MKSESKIAVFAILSLSCIFVTSEKRYCNDGLGECTAFDACSNLTIFNDGSDHLHVRFNIELETDACHYLEMCCDTEDVIKSYLSPYKETHAGITDVTGNNIDSAGDGEGNFRTLDDTTTHAPDTLPDTNLGESASIHAAGVPEKLPESENMKLQNQCNSGTHECIPYFYCSHDTTTDGARVLDSRTDAGSCVVSSYICCNKNYNIARFKPAICGIRNKDGIGYEVTNSIDEAQYAEFPWMAALSVIDENGHDQYLCGGSLIHPQVILTAAHCVHGKSNRALKVRLGEWDTQTTSEIFPHTDHEVTNVIIHSDFGEVNLFNDVALLILTHPVELSVHINTVCLPPPNYNFDHQSCFASGWGADKFGNKSVYRVNLKKITLPTLPLRSCQERLRNTKLGPRFKIHKSFMCAGGEHGVDTCTGDGGSPLVCPVPDKHEIYFQAGIVAWGIECGIENVPGVYVNVIKFRTWIDNHMVELGYGTQSYTLAI